MAHAKKADRKPVFGWVRDDGFAFHTIGELPPTSTLLESLGQPHETRDGEFINDVAYGFEHAKSGMKHVVYGYVTAINCDEDKMVKVTLRDRETASRWEVTSTLTADGWLSIIVGDALRDGKAELATFRVR